MKDNGLIIRHAVPGDYSSFKKMEEKAWVGVPEVPLITEEQFLAWIDVNPEGLWLGEYNNCVCAHTYCQNLHMDPRDKNEMRSFDEISDDATTRQTHKPEGQTCYVVSVSASLRKAGRQVTARAVRAFEESSQRFFVGTCRIWGLSAYMKSRGYKIASQDVVEKYIQAIYKTVKGLAATEEEVHDPVLSTFLNIRPGSRIAHPVPNFMHDRLSSNWACMIFYDKNDPEFYHD